MQPCLKFLYVTFFLFWFNGSFAIDSSVLSAVGEQAYIDTLDIKIKDWFSNEAYDFDDVVRLFDKTELSVIERFGTKSLAYAYILHKKGVFYANWGDETESNYLQVITYFKEALEIRESKTTASDSLITPLIILGYLNIGDQYYWLQKPYKALDYLIKGIGVAENFPNRELVIKYLIKLYVITARVYDELGDYDNSIKYYSTAIYLNWEGNDEQLSEILETWKIRALIEKGSIEAWPLNDAESAIKDLHTGLKVLLDKANQSQYDFLIASAYYKLGTAYYISDNFDKSNSYFNKALEIYVKHDLREYIFYNYISLSILYLYYSNNDRAEFYLGKARSLLSGEDLPEKWLLLWENLGDLEFKKGNYQRSLEYDNRAIQTIIPSFKPKTIFNNPDFESIVISDKPSLLELLNSRASAFLQLYKTDHEISNLQLAYQNFLLANELINLIRGEFLADASKMNLVEQTKPIYERAVETCWQLYLHTKEEKYKNQAFQFSEKSRSIILLDAVRKTAARSKLPQDLVKKEKQLNLKVNYYEKLAALQEQRNETSEKSKNYYDSLLAFRRKHTSVIQSIEKEYPDYHLAIFGKELSSISDVQNLIMTDRTFIEYFAGDSNLYAFVVNKGTSEFYKLGAIDSLSNWILEFNNSIQNKDQEFIHPAYQLYTCLLGKLEKNVSLSDQLIIVPDGLLSFVCFDALVVKEPENKRIYFPDFKDFLIYQYQVNYVFSASSLMELQAESASKLKSFLGIAPDLNEGITVDGTYFESLNENIREIKQAKRLFPGNKIFTSYILKNDFFKKAGSYNIIHIASHAKANIENGDLSFILLGPDESQKLYTKELYATDLNAKMVLMSACQTGMGSMVRGEGTISLARGFIYAGSSSVITSLWNVREKSNREIILNFYKGIKEGKTKDHALRDAKLSYIESITRESQEQAHPFYWGPLICVGDINPLQIKPRVSSTLILIVTSLIIFLIIAFFLYKAKK